jgi:hydroxymethylpyrimidine/phosphomethylpyrimidine kinase
VALTIAGSDSGSGAGVQADLKTMGALGVFAVTAVTAVTAQSTTGVRSLHAIPTAMVASQIETVLDDFDVVAAKTGMLATKEIVELVAGLARDRVLPRLVVDPVATASTGEMLLDEGLGSIREHLVPHAFLVTPNAGEAAALAGLPVGAVHDLASMVAAARVIHRAGPEWVLVTGGHVEEAQLEELGLGTGAVGGQGEAVDVLFDGEHAIAYGAPRVETHHTHGTGCTLSAAITAFLARGANPPDAVHDAKVFVTRALRGAAPWHLGDGDGPLDHLGWSTPERTEARDDSGRAVWTRPLPSR